MKVKMAYLCMTLALGLGLTLAVLWLLGGSPLVARADPGTLYVAPTGTDSGDCTNSASPCRTVQYAVDQASTDDDIRVAAGTYTDVHQRDGITQVVYISKALTLRGGYTTTNWTASYPITQPTTLDALGLGRALVISGAITSTIEGLRITGGDATGLGGGPNGWDAGGGVYVYTATATISNCVVYSNTASTGVQGYGGGLFLWETDARLSGNTVVSNTASTGSGDALRAAGGGLCLVGGRATLSDNTVQGNTAGTGHRFVDSSMVLGGGLILGDVRATLSGNTVQGNTASTADQGNGGGLVLWGSDATLLGNTIVSNTASTADDGVGGGLYLWESVATLVGNTIVSNTATLSPTAYGYGGGLAVGDSSPFTLTNNLVADNHANTEGSGLWFGPAFGGTTAGQLLHTTIADNAGGSGQGVYVGISTTLAFTNTILSGHATVGISATAGSTVTLEATLWHNNGADTGGPGTVFSSTNVYGDPAFVNPAVWDYHLTAASAAINSGLDAGVTTDFEDDARPGGGGFDLGCDETSFYIDLSISKTVTPTMATPGQPITYTITFTHQGTGGVAHNVLITDIVPISVTNVSFTSSGAVISQTNTGVLTYTWEVADLSLGEGGAITITGQLSATLAAGATFTNTVVITTTVLDGNPGNNSSDAGVTVIAGGTITDEVETATGTGTAEFRTGSGGIEDLAAVAEATLTCPEAGKPGLDFVHGFFSFNITGLTAGETVVITITLPAAVPVGTEYWKCHEPEGWVQVPIGSDGGDNVITITLVDGGLGDDDGLANGVIVDPGGPGQQPPPPPPPKPVGGVIVPVNKLGLLAPWMGLAALAALAALGFALVGKRRSA